MLLFKSIHLNTQAAERLVFHSHYTGYSAIFYYYIVKSPKAINTISVKNLKNISKISDKIGCPLCPNESCFFHLDNRNS